MRNSKTTYLRVHLDEVEEDHVFAFYLDGFVERVLRLRLDHLVKQLSTHGREVLFPQVIL